MPKVGKLIQIYRLRVGKESEEPHAKVLCWRSTCVASVFEIYSQTSSCLILCGGSEGHQVPQARFSL